MKVNKVGFGAPSVVKAQRNAPLQKGSETNVPVRMISADLRECTAVDQA